MSTVGSLSVSIVRLSASHRQISKGTNARQSNFVLVHAEPQMCKQFAFYRVYFNCVKKGANIFQPFLNANGADHRHLFFYSFRSGVQMSGVKGECSGKRGVGLFNADENAVVVFMAVLAV